MAHAVMRGEPTQAQLYLEGVITELIKETGREEDRYCVNKILYKCLRDNPEDIRHIEATSGESVTNRSLLERSIKAVRALQNSGLKIGDTVVLITRTFMESLGLYYGAILAGINIYTLFYEFTVYELERALKLKMPKIIFAEESIVKVIEEVLHETNWDIKLVVFGETKTNNQKYNDFISGFDKSIEEFWPADMDINSTVLTIGTSGTTGLPKAAELTSRGLTSRLPLVWLNSNKFPKPYQSLYGPFNYHGATMNDITLGCAVFGVTVILTTTLGSAEHDRMVFRKYRPDVAVLFGKSVQSLLALPESLPDDYSSLQVIMMGGSSIPAESVNTIKKLAMPNALVGTAMGMTEMGLVAMISHETPIGSLGKVTNIFDYKIVDKNYEKVKANTSGELILKSNESIFKGYSQNEEAYKNAFTKDGWFKTGDRVYENEKGELFYEERIKFLIKYDIYQVSPSEVEAVISGLGGVLSVAVCESSNGPAALVVPRDGASINPQDVHDVVKGKLTDYKRLRGGVVFVDSLPFSNNLKLERGKVKQKFDNIDRKHIHYDATL